MSEGKKDFVVKDKRQFTETASSPEQDKERGSDPTAEAADDPADEPGEPAAGSSEARLPKIDFATFIFSLNSAVLVHLGAMEDPATGQDAKNLAMAKQTIDILGMLEEKTRGNLTPDEENMLKNILYDLRIRYVRERG
jgi:hypothetical protein